MKLIQKQTLDKIARIISITILAQLENTYLVYGEQIFFQGEIGIGMRVR